MPKIETQDSGRMDIEFTVKKYYGNFKNAKEAEEKAKPFEVVTVRKNILLSEGIQAIWQLTAGVAGVNPFNATYAHIGVGDGTASASRDQTGLQGTNKYYRIVDSAPTIEQDTGVSPPTYRIKFTATFGGDEANFSWNEATVANGNSDNAVNLDRIVGNFGTKASGQTWVANLAIRLT